MNTATIGEIRVRCEIGGETLLLEPGSELGAGGQATVYPVPGRDGRVAKLYHQPAAEQERRLHLMIADRPAGATTGPGGGVFAWPLDLLRDGGGRCVGLLLPRVDGKLRVFELYNPATRRDRAPLFHHGLLHRAARNLAAAFHKLHEAGFVVGDVNESNILVGEDGRVTLIDTDSFQVRDPVSGVVFRCPVGRPEFTPPELREHRFAEVDRAPEHDRFGLGVLVFQMLMEGTHPFAGRWRGAGEPPSVEERIAAGHFPYAGLPGVPLEPARTAPPLEVLDPGLRALLARCFVDGHRDPAARPGADEWRDALAAAERALVACGRNEQHLHGGYLDACPWCERARRLEGRDPFPSERAVERGEHRRRTVPARAPLRQAPKAALRPRFRGIARAGPWPLPAEMRSVLLGAAFLLALLSAVSATIPPLPVALAVGGLLAVARRMAQVGTPSQWATGLSMVLVGIGFASNGEPVSAAPDFEPPMAVEFPTYSAPYVELSYQPGEVDERPVLLDPEELAVAVALLRREPEDSLLPPVTNLNFTVDARGRIDPARLWTTWRAESQSLDRARAELLAVRFRPGMLEGTAVPTAVGVPVVWTDGIAKPVFEAATWNPAVDSLPDILSMSDPAAREHRAAVAVADAEVKPALLNAREVQALLAEVYPPLLREAGVTGQTHVKFVVDARGRVDPASIATVSTTHDAFAEASVEVVGRMRFSPARVDGREVPVLIQIPISWTLERG
jgi:TonB family protein